MTNKLSNEGSNGVTNEIVERIMTNEGKNIK